MVADRVDGVQIDGDWVLHLRKEELGRKLDFTEIDLDICKMAEAFAWLGRRVVVAQVILPGTLHTYAEYFEDRKISYRFVVLMPSESALLGRNAGRKCWPKTTPEYWVKKFHADLGAGPASFRQSFHDNSTETPVETAAHLMADCGW